MKFKDVAPGETINLLKDLGPRKLSKPTAYIKLELDYVMLSTLTALLANIRNNLGRDTLLTTYNDHKGFNAYSQGRLHYIAGEEEVCLAV